MITVEDIIKSNKDSAKITGEQNEEKLKTGEIKAQKQTYWPWILLAGAAIIGGIWWYKKNKNENGAISG